MTGFEKQEESKMNLILVSVCPSTLEEGFDTYSRKALKNLFHGKKVSHILPYHAPYQQDELDQVFDENLGTMSISGVQEKFSVMLEKNRIRLTKLGERGEYILKPIPLFGKNRDQMPANEHLTMQIAKQIYGIETAENGLIWFKDGNIAYITKRFDYDKDGKKLAQDDFASLAGRTVQTHGAQYKYLGNYLEIFKLMQKYLPTYQIEATKLFKLLIFNYLFSNGDAHFKNFSIIETPLGDYRLSPAYDLLNSRLHVTDSDFALKDGLLPPNLAQGKIAFQFETLAQNAGISKKIAGKILSQMLSKSDEVSQLISRSYLKESLQRNYWQAYQGKLKQLQKG